MRGSAGYLHVETENSGGKTQLRDCAFRAPLKLAQPFKNADGGITLMVMSASAGVLEGDTLETELVIGRDCDVTVTEQSYTKIFKMTNGAASRKTAIRVQGGACLRYLPQPVIPFAGSDCASRLLVELDDGAGFVCRDILSCGRVGMGERFAFTRFAARTQVYHCGRLILLEQLLIEPQRFFPDTLGDCEGFTHQASMFFFGPPCPGKERLAALPDAFPDVVSGFTRTLGGGLLLRLLGHSADRLVKVCDAAAG